MGIDGVGEAFHPIRVVHPEQAFAPGAYPQPSLLVLEYHIGPGQSLIAEAAYGPRPQVVAEKGLFAAGYPEVAFRVFVEG